MAAFSSIAGMALAAAAAAAAAKALSKKPQMPDLPDPAAERVKAEAEALKKTNSALAQRNRARAASSLLARKPVDTATSDVSALGAAPGKTTLGQ